MTVERHCLELMISRLRCLRLRRRAKEDKRRAGTIALVRATLPYPSRQHVEKREGIRKPSRLKNMWTIQAFDLMG